MGTGCRMHTLAYETGAPSLLRPGDGGRTLGRTRVTEHGDLPECERTAGGSRW